MTNLTFFVNSLLTVNPESMLKHVTIQITLIFLHDLLLCFSWKTEVDALSAM